MKEVIGIDVIAYFVVIALAIGYGRDFVHYLRRRKLARPSYWRNLTMPPMI
jgi:hypothetical protein